MSSRLLTLLLCALLLAGLTVTAAQATVNLESGKVGIVFEDGEFVAVNDDVDEAVDMSDF